MTIEQKLKRLAKALKSCDGTEDRMVARRNARARVLSALRAVWAHVDTVYPSIVSRRKRTPEERIARFKAKGYEWLGSGKFAEDIAADFADCGVLVKTVRVSNPQQEGDAIVITAYFIPCWAADIGRHDTAKLRAAVKSRTYRRALLVEAAILQNSN